MGTLFVDTLEPQSGTTLTVGETGQNTVVGGNTIKLNALQDAGGNAIFTSDGSGNLSSVNSGFGSPMVLISTQTASDDATLSFTSGITSTYYEYIFTWTDIDSATADANWEFQVNASGQTGYDETLTSSAYRAYMAENAGGALGYVPSDDQAQGTAYQRLIEGGGMPNEADASTSGQLHIFNPGSTTYVKNWYARGHSMKKGGSVYYSIDAFFGGYFNFTAALTNVQFKFSSGNISAGTIQMYGMK